MGGPHDKTDGVIPARVESNDLVDHELSCVLLEFGSLRIGGAGEHVDSPPAVHSLVDGRQQGADTKVGAERDRVCCQGRFIVEIGIRVTGHGGADIASFHVQQAERPGITDIGEHPLQHSDTPRSMGLKEGRLGFEHRDTLPQLLHDAAGALLETSHAGLQSPGRQHGGHGIDAHAEVPTFCGVAGKSLRVAHRHLRISFSPRTRAGPA